MKRVGDESPSRTGTGSSSDQKTEEVENNKKRMLFLQNKSWGQFEETDYSRYGSVAEEIKKINLRRMEIMNVVPSVHDAAVDKMKQHTTNAESEDMPVEKSNANNSTFVSESKANNDSVTTYVPIIILDSDDEDVTPQSQTNAHQNPVLEPAEQLVLSEVEIINGGCRCPLKQNADSGLHSDDETIGNSDHGDDGDDNEKTQCYVKNEVEDESQRNSFLGEGSKSDENIASDDNEKTQCYVKNEVEDESQRKSFLGEGSNIASDDEEMSENGLDDMWKEWGLAIENSKEPADFDDSAHNNSSKEPTEDCEHSLILRDDIGYVCRICGIIQKGIQDIFEFQYKISRSTRTYKYESRSKGDKGPLEFISDSMELLGNKGINNGNSSFYNLVEQTLQSEDLNIKLHVINDLREMTNNILHYYKGDFLDDLPGLEDFTVKLNLNVRQKNKTKKLKRFTSGFKRSSVGSAIYVHPDLKQYLEHVQRNGTKQASFDDTTIDGLIKEVDIKEGVKATFFLNVLKLCQITDEKLLVFSQYLLPLKFLERLTCNVMNWSLGREIFTITGDSSAEMREMSMKQFNNSANAKVFFGSIKACGEGISLVGASRIIILDVHLNPSVSRQAIGRAFRPGQEKKVYVYRLIAAESPEEKDHNTCFRKELVSKMWFEWNEYSKLKDFELKQVDMENCGDYILESPHIHGVVKALYKRLVS
ncbi:hypothetical protein QQ045_009778 [Rhodiola kirilowii]